MNTVYNGLERIIKVIHMDSDPPTLAVHLSIGNTSLFAIAYRSVEEVPVRLLEAIHDSDYSDPLLVEMIAECRAKLKAEIETATSWMAERIAA